MKKSNIFCYDRYLDISYIEKELTFEEICPIWSKKIRKGLDRKDKEVLATDSKYCVVGEAWGYSGKQAGYYFAPLIPFIGCWSCIKFGRKFAVFAKKDSISSPKFNILISEFLQHWNKKHKSITKAIL
ncbi:MAG: hypothetical protein ACE5SW_05515 [Nitrososphaeraceae archaeon]